MQIIDSEWIWKLCVCGRGVEEGWEVLSEVHWPNGWYYEANLHGKISKLDSVGQLGFVFVSKFYWIPGIPFVYLFCHCKINKQMVCEVL